MLRDECFVVVRMKQLSHTVQVTVKRTGQAHTASEYLPELLPPPFLEHFSRTPQGDKTTKVRAEKNLVSMVFQFAQAARTVAPRRLSEYKLP